MRSPKLIILNGASGSGKTFAMEQMSEVSPRIQPIKKYTTRKPRSYEDEKSSIDLIFNVKSSAVRKFKYHYKYFYEDYGIDANEIETSLKSGKSPVVIVRDYDVIIQLLKDYPKAIVIYIHSACTGEELIRVLKEKGREDIDAEDRRIRELENFAQYIEYLDKELVDYHVYNYYNDSFIYQMKYYLSKHTEVRK